MHLLAAINNNVGEWRALRHLDPSRPRLPLPYAFGGAFMQAGHALSAIDTRSLADKRDFSPFQALYHQEELGRALQSVDVAALWGSDALKTILKQAVTPGAKRNILYFTYVLAPEKPTGKQRLQDMALRILARSMKGVVVMTCAHEAAARSMLPDAVPVIRMRCGIDTAFYRVPASMDDVPEAARHVVETLLQEPYVIMPGDELRYNDDAIRFVEQSGIRLVRISQYGEKSNTVKLKRDIAARKLEDRLIVFEKIDYSFLRFLLQHASAYAGLVDASWQPAGWTVACEAMASGLPMMLYDGLASREMREAGAPESCMQTVSRGDIAAFTDKLATLVKSNDPGRLAGVASTFAAQQLDFSVTAPPFVSRVEQLVASKDKGR